MNTFAMSNGERVKKSVLDRRVREAKAEFIAEFHEEHGFYYCENTVCNRSDKPPYDCAHIKSVKWCQENGQAELAWSKKNFKLKCRDCHQEQDGLNLMF